MVDQIKCSRRISRVADKEREADDRVTLKQLVSLAGGDD